MIAAGEDVDQGRFPGAVAVGGVDVGLALRVEQLAEIGESAFGDLEQRPGIDVHGGTVHGAKHLIGHRGRSGYAEELAAVADGHLGRLS